jgi:hypothetical protein
MKYICLTHVDAETKVVCTQEPMRTGPSFPEIKGLQIQWANQSTWPVPCNQDGSYSQAPKFYGVCDDDADLNVAGFISTHEEFEFLALKLTEHQARKPYASWVGDFETMSWSAPTPYPTDEKFYRWDEPTLSWIELM